MILSSLVVVLSALQASSQSISEPTPPKIHFETDQKTSDVKLMHLLVTCALVDHTGFWMNLFRTQPKEDSSGDNSVETCLRRSGRKAFLMPAVLMAGTFAEHLYLRSYASRPSALDSVPLAVFQTNVKMRNSIYSKADCVTQQTPSGIDALLRTLPTTAEETQALQAVSGVASTCGFTRVGRAEFRAATAEMLFRRVTPSLRELSGSAQ